MKCRKTIIQICIFLCICTITGLITACIIAKPISLTEDEINYYTNTAEKVWYEGLSTIPKDDSIIINCHWNSNQVTILPINTNKQSITVNFSDSEVLVTVHKPVTSFYGCFLFYGVFFGSIIYFILYVIISSRKK